MESFKVFDLVVMLTGGGPGSTTEVASLYIYRQAFQYFDMGYAAVLSMTLMSVVLVVFQRRRRDLLLVEDDLEDLI